MGSLFSFSKCHYLFSRKLNLYRHMIYPVFFIRKFHIISVTSGQDGIISAWNLHSDILKRHIHQLFNLFFLNDPFFCICDLRFFQRIKWIDQCESCICTLDPEKFGPLNEANRQLMEYAKEKQKLEVRK